ncbi:hypothetical protein AB4Z39_33665 [Mycobacterium adipatum]|uniref:hypothetical protein n=1 Tax=Mycobacterium adipatum TaxID=1682113 RepID=UPI0034E0AD82
MNTAADTEMDAEDYQPVELDTPSTLPPPPAALVAWQELADRDIEVMHDGDVSKMMPFPRPAWAEESYDLVGPSLLSTAYRSTVAHIPLSQTKAWLKTVFGSPPMWVCVPCCGATVCTRSVSRSGHLGMPLLM